MKPTNLLCLVVALGAALPAQDFESALERYRKCIKRKPFVFHTEGRQKIAATGDPRALPILVGDYRRPRAAKSFYKAYARYTIATLLGRHFNDADAVDQLGNLRADHKDADDAWLWVNTLKVDATHSGPGLALSVARESKNTALRAAAIEALAQAGVPEVLGLIPEVCAALPKKPGPRRLLIGPMSSAILANKGALESEHMQRAMKAYIGLLAKDVKLDLSAKLLIARHLSKTFARNAMYIEPEPWLRMLASSKGMDNKPTGRTVSTVRFFGIEAEGDRICYVIDMSDSMCKKVASGMKKKGPITGPRKKKKKRRKGVPPDESDIPWDKIETRFDLAREFLKISLQRLSKDKRFCIIWFGTKSGTLESTHGMIKATRANVYKVMKELDSIETGKPKPPDAPDGVLRGRTNMHAGLRRAFSMRAKGFADKAEYVDEKALALGCDTVFLLSDGAPSWDDFDISDKDYGEGRVVRDSEYGKGAPRTPTLIYWGPYEKSPWLTDDIRRMNVFRKAQIHCIGIGEANIGLLQQIAAMTMGEVFVYGEKAKRAVRK